MSNPIDQSPPGEPAPMDPARAVMAFTHDVINPLHVILSQSQMLLMQGRGDERLNEDLRRIQEAAEEALALVRSLGLQVGPARKMFSD